MLIESESHGKEKHHIGQNPTAVIDRNNMFSSFFDYHLNNSKWWRTTFLFLISRQVYGSKIKKEFQNLKSSHVRERYEAELCHSRNEITSCLRVSSSFSSTGDRIERIYARSILSTTPAWMSKSCDIHSIWSTTAWMSKSSDIPSSISIYTPGWRNEWESETNT